MHDRIMVIGCSGSGKSTFARALGERTGIPVVHLDRLYCRENWVHVSREEFDGLLMAELEKPRWVMDGNFDRTMGMRLEKCDTVVYFDLPRWLCIYSVVKRILTYHGKTRPDMGEGCPERFDLAFLKWIWNFNAEHREKTGRMLAEAKHAQVYTIRKRRELQPLMDAFASENQQ